MTDVAPSFLEHVRDRVCLATRDPQRQNRGRRTLYDWAEPSPGARLVWDVLEAVLDPMTERPQGPVQDVIIRIVDILAGSIGVDNIRSDVVSAMLTIWVASCQHHIVATRLSELLDGASGRAETLRHRRRRGFWIACHGAVRDSAAELWRRACMGDYHHVALLGGSSSRSMPRQPRRPAASAARRKPARRECRCRLSILPPQLAPGRLFDSSAPLQKPARPRSARKPSQASSDD